MEGYGTDSEQIEALRGWWTKNGRWVVTGLVIAALVIGGWRLWDYWQARRASAAAEIYAPVVIAEQKNDVAGVIKSAKAVIAQYPNTAYGALAGLALAKAQFVQHHYIKAESALREVMKHSPDEGFAAIARLRLASVELQRGKAKKALATLDAKTIPAAFAVSADTLRGAALHALGRNGEARGAWQKALAASSSTDARRRVLKMRLASLPAASGSAPAGAGASVPAISKPPASAAPARAAGSTAAPKIGTHSQGAKP